MESLQLSQVLADLSNLGAAEPDAAATIVSANTRVIRNDSARDQSSTIMQLEANRPSALQRALSSEGYGKVDKFGRRIYSSTPGSQTGSAANSIPGTPRGEMADGGIQQATTLMALYDIRAKLKQQDNSSLMKAREKINALAAKQQAQQAADRNTKAAEELRKNRYSFPKPAP